MLVRLRRVYGFCTVPSSAADAAAAPKRSPFIQWATAAGTVFSVGLHIKNMWDQREMENNFVQQRFIDVRVDYVTALLAERLSRDFFVKGSAFDAKSELHAAIRSFSDLLESLEASDPAKQATAQKLGHLLLNYAMTNKYLHEESSTDDLRWSLCCGLATCEYHMACLLGAEGSLDEAGQLLVQGSQRLKRASSLLISQAQDELPHQTEWSIKVLAWERQINRLRFSIINGKQLNAEDPSLQAPFPEPTGDTPFFLMRYQSQLAWSLLKHGKCEAAYAEMKICRTEALSLLELKSFERVQNLRPVQWFMDSSTSRFEECQALNSKEIHRLAAHWHEGMDVVDVLHDAQRVAFEKAERVRLTLRKQATSQLACVLLSLAAGDIEAFRREWETWQEFKSRPAYSLWCAHDSEWRKHSSRQAVCEAIAQAVESTTPVQSLPGVDQARSEGDWVWVLQTIESLQKGNAASAQCPRRWEKLARSVFDTMQQVQRAPTAR